jgi:hypothetical protein
MYARRHLAQTGRKGSPGSAGCSGRPSGRQAVSKAAGSSGLIVFVMLWHVMTMMIAEKKCISV